MTTKKSQPQPWATDAEHHLSFMTMLNSENRPDFTFSAGIGNISKAIRHVQTQVKSVHKGSEVNAGRIRYSYATYEDCVEAILPHLESANLSFVQPPGDGCVNMMVMHDSGEFIHARYFYKAEGAGSKADGSALSYAKRYVLLAMFGIPTTDEDDDAQAADGFPGLPKSGKRGTPASKSKEIGQLISKAKKLDDLRLLQKQIMLEPAAMARKLKGQYKAKKIELYTHSVSLLDPWFQHILSKRPDEGLANVADTLSEEGYERLCDLYKYCTSDHPDGNQKATDVALTIASLVSKSTRETLEANNVNVPESISELWDCAFGPGAAPNPRSSKGSANA